MQFDLMVIGAGAAGLSVATRAHRQGLRTALLEKHLFGGECTHTGCIPSKAFLQAAKQVRQKRQRPGPEDFRSAMEYVAQTVQTIYSHETPEVFSAQGIHTVVHPSGARFLDPHTVQIGDQTLQAKYIVLATGSSPKIPDFPGIEEVSILHNENFWELRQRPASICFVGGGVIAAELGQALARLGVQVTIVERWTRLIHRQGSGAQSDALQELLEEDGVQIRLFAEAERFAGPNQLILDDGQIIEADHFFISLGRKANLHGLGLENLEIEIDDQGVAIDDTLRTHHPHIYACGDIATQDRYSHVASYQAEIVLHNILHEKKRKDELEYLTPWAIFTEPEIAQVGLRAMDVEARYGEDAVEVTVPAHNDRFITDQKSTGYLQVFFEKEDGMILGAEAVGFHAAEWIQLLGLAIQQKLSAQQVLNMVFIYPTYTEIVRKACQEFVFQNGAGIGGPRPD